MNKKMQNRKGTDRSHESAEQSAWIHSVQTFGTLDGPGIRTVFFFQGCPFRCAYCHNPDTWAFHEGTRMSLSSMLAVLEENRPYFGGGGGVTISGGECLFQADFLMAFLAECRNRRFHTVIDTSGMSVCASSTAKILQKARIFKDAGLILLDVKFCSEEQYRRYTAGTLSEVLETLSTVQKTGTPVWIRQVVFPGINDTQDDIRQLKRILSPFSCVEKVELLPFKKLCLEKYVRLNLDFPFKDVPETSMDQIRSLQEYYDALP